MKAFRVLTDGAAGVQGSKTPVYFKEVPAVAAAADASSRGSIIDDTSSTATSNSGCGDRKRFSMSPTKEEDGRRERGNTRDEINVSNSHQVDAMDEGVDQQQQQQQQQQPASENNYSINNRQQQQQQQQAGGSSIAPRRVMSAMSAPSSQRTSNRRSEGEGSSFRAEGVLLHPLASPAPFEGAAVDLAGAAAELGSVEGIGGIAPDFQRGLQPVGAKLGDGRGGKGTPDSPPVPLRTQSRLSASIVFSTDRSSSEDEGPGQEIQSRSYTAVLMFPL